MLILKPTTLEKLLLPLVAFAAGSVIAAAILPMIPAAVAKIGNTTATFGWVVAGFLFFLALEQFLHWPHGHSLIPEQPQPRA